MPDDNPTIRRLVNFLTGYVLFSAITAYWVVARGRLRTNHPYFHLLYGLMAVSIGIIALYHRSTKIAIFAFVWALIAIWLTVQDNGLLASFYN